MLLQLKARGQPKKTRSWIWPLGLFASERGRPADQACGDNLTGRQPGAADAPSTNPAGPLPASRADTPPTGPIDAGDRQREREMASDESARRASRLGWHRTAQIVVLITVVLVLSHALHLPMLTMVPIALGGLVSANGGVGLFTVILRWRQPGGRDDESDSGSSDAGSSL